jgi:hypothetical protein
MSQSITAQAINDHVLPQLAFVIDEAVNAAVGDDLGFIGEQLESIAASLKVIAAAVQHFSPDA